MIKYFTIEDLLKHYLQKKFHILQYSQIISEGAVDGQPPRCIGCAPGDAFFSNRFNAVFSPASWRWSPYRPEQIMPEHSGLPSSY